MRPTSSPAPALPAPAALLLASRLHDPTGYLGVRQEAGQWMARLFLPYAQGASVWSDDQWHACARAHPDGIFEWKSATAIAVPLRVRVEEGGVTLERYDPYGFPVTISDDDIFLFNAGRLRQGYRVFGAHVMESLGVAGVRFAVWAPNAERVSVIGDFNRWDGRTHPMRVRGSSGVWELFIPGLADGALYKFEIRNRDTGAVLVKADPYASACEFRPKTAARVTAPSAHAWGDAGWLDARAKRDWLHAPMSIYELHAGSWRRHPDGRL